MNSYNKLHGRGIRITPDGFIVIGYWNDGDGAPGNNLYIYSWGDVQVGEFYLKKGERWERGTQYNTNGTTEKYD